MLSSRAVRVVFAELSSCLVRKYLIDRRKLALILLCALFPLVSASQKVWGQATINQFEVSEVNFPAQLVGARILGINDNGDLVGIDPQGELFLHLRGTGFRRMAGVVPGQLTSLNGFNNAATSLVRYRSSTTGSLRTGLVRSNRSFSVVLGPQTSSQLFIPIALGATDTVGGILAGQLGPVMCQASSCQSYRVSGQVTYASVEDVNERGTIVGSISTPTRGQVATRFYPNREEMLQIPQVIGASYAVNISSNDAALVVGDVGPSASSCFGQSPCLRSFVVDNAGRSFRLLDPKHWREHYQQVNSFLQVPGIWRYGSVNRYWTPFLYWAHSTQSIRFEA